MDVLEGVGGEPSAAAMVVKIARTVYELLLAQVSELAELQQVVGLEGAHRGEGPAAAAVALVLDGGHSAHVPPVPVGGQVLQLVLLGLHLLVVGGRAVLGVFRMWK